MGKLLLAVCFGGAHDLLLIGYVELDMATLPELRGVLTHRGRDALLRRVVLG